MARFGSIVEVATREPVQLAAAVTLDLLRSPTQISAKRTSDGRSFPGFNRCRDRPIPPPSMTV
jgi:hypothetical protein